MAQAAPRPSSPPPPPAPAPTSGALLGTLGGVCRDRGLGELASRLLELDAWVRAELREFEHELRTVPDGARAVQRAAHHLLDLGGKHLRPMCVVLASKVGGGFGPDARQLALAVELVHTATLLHDDVVDVADARRGQPTARTLWGNAASIFAGDWLLVEALRRIRGAGDLALLDRMLAIIEEMILAESLQLERRGKITGEVADYFRVCEGKTAALFRWAMLAGARAGGCAPEHAAALERFGHELGVAFQVIDDCLDFEGDFTVTGKALFADLREGKLTYPVLLGLERDPALAALVGEAIARADDGAAEQVGRHRAIAERIHACGALADARRAAAERIGKAVASLAGVPDGPGKAALITVAEATATRER